MAKMTPFRSYIVTVALAANVAILGTVQLKGGVITYIVVSTLADLQSMLCVSDVSRTPGRRSCQSATSHCTMMFMLHVVTFQDCMLLLVKLASVRDD